MRKTLVTLAATAALALGGLSAAPKPADAAAWWVAPAIIGGAFAGVAAGAAVASADPYYVDPYAYAPAEPYAYAPAGSYASEVYVAPSDCYWARQRIPGGWQRIRVCD